MKWLVSAGIAFALWGCGSGDPELTCSTNPPSVTLEANVQAVFTDRCTSGCHEDGYSYGDYTTVASTLEGTVGKKSAFARKDGALKVVDPGNLANSTLWLKILGGSQRGRTGPKGENVYGAMPNDRTTLGATQKQLFKDWICSGAQ